MIGEDSPFAFPKNKIWNPLKDKFKREGYDIKFNFLDTFLFKKNIAIKWKFALLQFNFVFSHFFTFPQSLIKFLLKEIYIFLFFVL